MIGFVVHALHVRNPLLDLRLFKNRNFSIANICMFVMGATLYGSMFLLPLYYQIARGQSAWQAGLLMAPQGIGAALLMRKSGAITDRNGPRRVVPVGIVIMAVATIPFAFVTSSTSEVLLAGTLFVRGLGLGLTMMPVMSAAYFDLSHADIPKASTTLNIVRQIGASIATAAFAVILQRGIVENTHSHGSSDSALLSTTVRLPPEIAEDVAPRSPAPSGLPSPPSSSPSSPPCSCHPTARWPSRKRCPRAQPGPKAATVMGTMWMAMGRRAAPSSPSWSSGHRHVGAGG